MQPVVLVECAQDHFVARLDAAEGGVERQAHVADFLDWHRDTGFPMLVKWHGVRHADVGAGDSVHAGTPY